MKTLAEVIFSASQDKKHAEDLAFAARGIRSGTQTGQYFEFADGSKLSFFDKDNTFIAEATS